MLRRQVLSVYRKLLRAQQNTFSGDLVRIVDCRRHTRLAFGQNRAETDPKTIQKMIKTAEQVEIIVRRNVVQGRRKHGEDHTFVLNLTADKEINSNDTIKSACGQPAQKL